ncbi:hypothetical protein G7Z17_g954 [Cylindrodendrum hubeiense]|uniref:Uncharacterized protein n=1 Tax=Cylindrodendrum hubeiense TaxID=595255 RepID=A0A9P5LFV7_9HYPO|nr:hypothetical protein G7Z17_g954 [Cylindrodendrum hubeiense]
MAVLEPYKHGYYLWKYIPSIEVAGIFCVLFSVATGFHAYRIFKTRQWFCIPFAIGGYMQFVGYACRAAAHDRTGKLMPYAISNNNILLAPVLYAASIYMTLGRIVRSVHGEKYSLINVKWLTVLFVSGDILSLAIQGAAAGMMIHRVAFICV